MKASVGGVAHAVLTSRALVTSRDGTVGRWQGPVGTPKDQHPMDPENLDLWSRSRRLQVVKAELLSGISYRDTVKKNRTELVYLSGDGDKAKPLVTICRPDFKGDYLTNQLRYVQNYAALRLERSAEINVQLTDILSFIGTVENLHPHRHRHTLELLTAILNVTVLVEQRVKHGLACRRPAEYSPQIQPMIQTPGHSSFPSGHATEAFTAAFVLFALLHDGKPFKTSLIDEKSKNYKANDGKRLVFEHLMRHAERIAINRTVAGVHFPVDSAAGLVLAWTLSEYCMARCSSTIEVRSREFDGPSFDKDFSYDDVLKNTADGKVSCHPEQSPELAYLWTNALREWGN